MKKSILILLSVLGLISCSRTTSLDPRLPEIWPDYTGVTVPVGTAPLNFEIGTQYSKVFVRVQGADGSILKARGKTARFSVNGWHRLTEANAGDSLRVTVLGLKDGAWTQWKDFPIYVSADTLDAWGVVYRKIAPGYETYSKIGNYQRNIRNFKETPIIESTLTPGQCVNCHTANATNPDQYTFHLRGKHGGTYFQVNGEGKWLTTKTANTISNAVYPYWHPGGDYCACSNNFIHQSFWTGSGRLIEVWDDASDISVIDVRTDEVITSPLVHTDWYETYPAFSPDGRTLYYCTAFPEEVPANAEKVRYNLCSIDFDPETGSFGSKVDTLINCARKGRSITFPRPSYDGRFILYSEADFGCFPINHKEADLYLLDLNSGKRHALAGANSEYAESFHNWSADSHWILFSSRRADGLYSLLYICHIDEDGNASKPFLLPQKNPGRYYVNSLYSFNCPDFTSSKVKFRKGSTWKQVTDPDRLTAKDRITTDDEEIISDPEPADSSAPMFMQ